MSELVPPLFERFCPLINQDCIGQKCASYHHVTDKHFIADSLIETYLKTNKGKKVVYCIIELHICGERDLLHYSCNNFKHLKDTITMDRKLDKLYTEHRQREWIIPSPYYIITKDFQRIEKEVLLETS